MSKFNLRINKKTFPWSRLRCTLKVCYERVSKKESEAHDIKWWICQLHAISHKNNHTSFVIRKKPPSIPIDKCLWISFLTYRHFCILNSHDDDLWEWIFSIDIIVNNIVRAKSSNKVNLSRFTANIHLWRCCHFTTNMRRGRVMPGAGHAQKK